MGAIRIEDPAIVAAFKRIARGPQMRLLRQMVIRGPLWLTIEGIKPSM